MAAVRGDWVRKLQVSEAPTPTPACPAATIEDFEDLLGVGAVRWGVRTAHDITVSVGERLPVFSRAGGAFTLLRLGIESGVLSAMVNVDAGRIVSDAVTPEAIESAQEYVHRRIPLATVLTSVRWAHRRLSEYLMGACTELLPLHEQPAQLRMLSDVLFQFVNDLAEGLANAYEFEEERWSATAAAVRGELVEKLLRGDSLDNSTEKENVVQSLRYEVEYRHHVGVHVWRDKTASDDLNALPDAALRWLEAAGAHQTLLLPQGRSLLWAWGNRKTDFAATRPSPPPTPPGLRFAIGTPSWGLGGFRQTHADARAGHRLALIAPGLTSAVVDYPSINLLALLSTDPAKAAEFAARELGELGRDDPHTVSLRETVLAYLETRSPQAAAARLYVARNTVSYRLKRAEELLGHAVTERSLELWTALVILNAFNAD